MRKIISVIYLLCFFSLINTLSAQVTFTASSETAQCDNANFCVEISVTNFDSVTSFQHVYDWDTTIMQMTTFTDLMPEGFGVPPNQDSTDVGRGPYAWFNSPYTNLTDGFVIAEICFAANNVGTGTVNFEGTPTTLLTVSALVNGVNTGDVPAMYNSGNITVQDTENPVIVCPSDTTIVSNGTNVSGIAPVSFSDNCEVASVSYTMMNNGMSVGSGNDDASGEFFGTGTTTVTYVITDVEGNSENCSFDVILNPIPPGAGDLQFIPEVNFDCDAGTVSIDMLVVNFDSITGIQYGIEWDTSNLTFINTVNALPPAATYNNVNDSTIAFFWFPFSGNPLSLADSSVIFTLNYSLNGSFDPPLLDFVSFPGVPIGAGQIQDGMDVSIIPNFLPEIINVIDNTGPMITDCPANIMMSTDPDSCNAVVNWVAPTITDNCGIDTIIVSHMPGDIFNVGTTTVSYTVTDIGGNTETCSFDVTVNDTEDPVITCPGDMTEDAIAGTCTNNTINIGTATATDNCGIASITNDAPASFPVGETTVTYTVTDINGLTATCTQLITIEDNELPMITCPGDIDQCPGTTVTLGTPTTSDNCGVASVTNDAPATFPIGTTVVTWTVTDDNGNTATCTQNVTLSDTEDPMITCPTDIGECPGATITLGTPTTSDNCGVASVTNDAPSPFPIGITIVTWTVTDVAGNTATCQQRVTIQDDEAPMITCPGTDAVDAAPGSCSAVYTNSLTPTVSDNCDMDLTVTYTINNGGVITNGTDDATGETFNVGSNNLTYYVEDDNGNIDSCTVVVQVNDNQLPSLTCPGNVTVFVSSSTVDTMINGISLTASDNCGILSTTFVYDGELTGNGIGDDASGTSFPVGLTTITYYVEDVNGNQDSCSFDVNVLTVSNDLIDCPSDQTVSNDLDSCGAVVNGLTPIFIAPMGDISSITYVLEDATTGGGNDDASGEYFNVGTTLITYTAMDNFGNSDTCAVLVTVNDTQLPVWLNCPIDINESVNIDGTCTAMVNWVAPIADDNCGVVQIIPSHSPGDIFPVGTTTVSYVALDAAGNIGTCSFDVTVADNTPPVPVDCPLNITLDANLPDCKAIASWTPPTFTDCLPISVTSTHDPGDMFPLGTTTVIYIAVDGNGNDTTCTFNVTIIDDEAPVPTCPSDITVNSLANNCGAFVNWPTITATDNCDDNVVITESPAMGTFFPLGATTVTVTATDDAGNSNTCTFDVIVNDAIAPEFVCAEDVTINLDGTITPSTHPYIVSAAPNANCDGMVVVYDNPTSTDNCGVDNVTVTGIGSGGDFPIGTSNLVFTAFDAANNFSTCSYNVTIVGFEAISVDIMQSDEVCEGEDITFTTDGNTTGATFDWDGPNMFDSQDSNPFINNVTIDNAGTYTVVITYPGGCTVTGSADLTVNIAAPISVTTNSPVCTEGDIEFDLAIPGGAIVENINWSGPDNFTSNVEDPVIMNATSINSGVYSVNVEYSNGCVASTSTTVVFASLPTPEIDMDCESDICLGSGCILTGTEYAPTPDNYIWTAQPEEGAGLPDDTNDNQISITPTLPGTYIYTYSVMLGECLSEEISQVVIVHDIPEAVDDAFNVPYETAQEVFVTENDIFNTNIGVTPAIVSEPMNGTVELTGDGRFTYTPNSGFIGTDQFIYEICYDCGPLLCENALVTITVADDRECVFPTVITPNKDGINDELFINCLEGGNFLNNEIIIYNQWGDEVFTAAPYQNNWEGTHDGNDLPDGTYYMVFKLDDNAELVKQFITIFR